MKIGEVDFGSTQAARRFFQSTLFADFDFTKQQRVVVNGNCAGPLSHLVTRHPRYDEMTRNGIDYFAVVPSRSGTRCFAIVDRAGGVHEFSYRDCLSDKKMRKRRDR